MRVYDVIAKKRDGAELSQEEIQFLLNGYAAGDIPDYQMSAFTMAVFFQGMTARETAHFTQVMLQSGDQIDLSDIPGVKVDKHSTGGVGDKTTLVVAPLVAAAGIPVAKMSGRGLGHTGGTLDKLAAIPGLQVDLAPEQFLRQVREVGLAVVGQTGNLVPADKKLYALRDVTATVNSLPLIASSIMSKKLASGADKIILDVKVGSGAFMKTAEEAFALAKAMVDIGSSMKRETTALVSDMDQPLGKTVGNALEVVEAVETLKGHGPEDLRQLCLELGARMLAAAGKAADEHRGKEILTELLRNGSGLKKLREMVTTQGGNAEALENYNLLPRAQVIIPLYSKTNGYISHLHAEKVGLAAMAAGAGRSRKEDEIDLAAGIVLKAKRGDKVAVGEQLAEIHAADERRAAQATDMLAEAFTYGQPEKHPLILGFVTDTGEYRNAP
ncbi:pyrimidine-nucleoside phosphorylase [Metallumcola ferriviriculae]|uniref:Pyrimidine-nucleoside phosphorylase n=1 Tax=Metallumcola ferriviriculae TaxID=3039180 RepID=A0AAU0US50_9FIRM|nr:pyrimidine-nucleoside phosphorylase [Desulfitibacteraceae bacterium MK1]